MPIPPSGPLQVKLGELAFAGVGVPGRRLVHHPVRGWMAEAERAWRIRSLPLWVTFLLPLGVLVGLLAPRHVGVGVVPPLAPASAPPTQAAASAAVVVPPTPLPPVPMPSHEPAPPVLPATVAAPSRKPARPASSPPRRTATATASATARPAAPVVFNDVPPAEPKVRARDVLVAIQDAHTIVTPGPRGLPVPFRVGDLLPSGARLLRVDARSGEAETDRGTLRLE